MSSVIVNINIPCAKCSYINVDDNDDDNNNSSKNNNKSYCWKLREPEIEMYLHLKLKITVW